MIDYTKLRKINTSLREAIKTEGRRGVPRGHFLRKFVPVDPELAKLYIKFNDQKFKNFDSNEEVKEVLLENANKTWKNFLSKFKKPTRYDQFERNTDPMELQQAKQDYEKARINYLRTLEEQIEEHVDPYLTKAQKAKAIELKNKKQEIAKMQLELPFERNGGSINYIQYIQN